MQSPLDRRLPLAHGSREKTNSPKIQNHASWPVIAIKQTQMMHSMSAAIVVTHARHNDSHFPRLARMAQELTCTSSRAIDHKPRLDGAPSTQEGGSLFSPPTSQPVTTSPVHQVESDSRVGGVPHGPVLKLIVAFAQQELLEASPANEDAAAFAPIRGGVTFPRIKNKPWNHTMVGAWCFPLHSMQIRSEC